MISYPQRPGGPVGRLVAGTLAAACLCVVLAPAGAAPAQPITQRRINELAASCLSTEMALSGLTGNRKAGETSAEYEARVNGYLHALGALRTELRELRRVPQLSDSSQTNIACWRRIVADVNRLPAAGAAARAAWAERGRGRTRLGPALLEELELDSTILNGLRDARP